MTGIHHHARDYDCYFKERWMTGPHNLTMSRSLLVMVCCIQLIIILIVRHSNGQQ